MDQTEAADLYELVVERNHQRRATIRTSNRGPPTDRLERRSLQWIGPEEQPARRQPAVDRLVASGRSVIEGESYTRRQRTTNDRASS